MIEVTMVALATALWAVLARLEDRRRFAWERLSFEARLRECGTRCTVFERALARLRQDAAAGRLTLDDDYRSLFDRLTAEAAGAGRGEV